jgi:hypothetical protein
MNLAMAKQARRQASNHRGPSAQDAIARARTRGGEDPNGGPRRHPSSGQGGGSLRQP